MTCSCTLKRKGGKKKQRFYRWYFQSDPQRKQTSERYTVCTITSCFSYWLAANAAWTHCLWVIFHTLKIVRTYKRLETDRVCVEPFTYLLFMLSMLISLPFHPTFTLCPKSDFTHTRLLLYVHLFKKIIKKTYLKLIIPTQCKRIFFL